MFKAFLEIPFWLGCSPMEGQNWSGSEFRRMSVVLAPLLLAHAGEESGAGLQTCAGAPSTARFCAILTASLMRIVHRGREMRGF